MTKLLAHVRILYTHIHCYKKFLLTQINVMERGEQRGGETAMICTHTHTHTHDIAAVIILDIETAVPFQKGLTGHVCPMNSTTRPTIMNWALTSN